MGKAKEQKVLDAIAQLKKRLEGIDAGQAHEEKYHIHDLLESKVDALADVLALYVRAYPLRSATIAFLLGVLISSRRRDQ